MRQITGGTGATGRPSGGSAGRRIVIRVAMAGGLAAVLAAPSLLSSGGGGHGPPECSDIVLIAARESGVAQAAHDGLGRPGQIFRDTLMRRLAASGQTLSVRPVVYPAAPVFFDADVRAALDPEAVQLRAGALNTYYASAREGLRAAQRAVAEATKDIERCGGHQHMVLFGFSQGAQLMGDLLPALPARARAVFGGAALLADPQFNAGEGADVARGDFEPGRSGLFGARPLMPAGLSGRVLSFCRSKDIACQGLRLQAGPPPEYCPLRVKLNPQAGPPVDGYFDLDCRTGPENVHQQYLFSALQAGNEVANRLGLFGERMSLPSPPVPGRPLDAVFLIDTTSSMTLYANRARTAVNEIVDELVAVGGDYRFGVATFRDRGDVYLSRVDLPFTRDVAALRAALEKTITSGGADFREAVHSGLMTAFSFPWRSGAKRAVVLLGDAPPKDPEPVTELTAAKVLATAREASAVLYSVIAANNELARGELGSLAAATGGRAFPITSLEELAPSVAAALTDASRAPIAQFNGERYSGVAHVPVRLYGLASYDADGDIVRYEWDFDGDGGFDESTTEPIVDHAYPPGTYASALRVVDNDGRTATAGTTVVVTAADRPVPGAPSDLVAARVGGKLAFRWTAPSGNGAPILYYLVRDAGRGAPLILAPGNVTEVQLDPLDAQEAYRFDVTAFSERGPGPPSPPVSATPGA